MYLARGLLCVANRCLLVTLILAFPKNRIKKEAAWVQAGKHHTMQGKFSGVSKTFLLFTSSGRDKSEPWQLRTIRYIRETECRLQIGYLHGRLDFLGREGFFEVCYSSHLLITKRKEDQNISLALLLSESDFSQEIYIFLSFSVKVSSPVFSPKEL